MKQVFAFILMIYGASGYSQEFNGFGRFKLGLTEDDFINNIAPDINKKITVVDDKNIDRYTLEWTNYIGERPQPQRVYLLNYKSKSVDWPIIFYQSLSRRLSQISDSCKIYYLPKYQLGDIPLGNIFLVFRKAKLDMIELNQNYDLTKAAVEKYPPTFKKDTSYKVTCRYVVSGVPEKKTVGDMEYYWKYSNSTCVSIGDMDYDEDCKVVLTNYIRVSTNDILDYMKQLEKERNNQQKKIINNKINSIKDSIMP